MDLHPYDTVCHDTTHHDNTNNLQQNSTREKRQIENADSHVEFRRRSQKSKPQQGIALESTSLIQRHDSLLNFFLIN